jgi:multidrug efflux pump subunit AcrA (membrane-fusion protein)
MYQVSARFIIAALRAISVGALALPLVFLPGCKEETVPAAVVAVQAEHPEQGTISDHVDASAVLAPVAQAAIAPRISAPVKKFYVQRGSRVHAGELLATLDNSDLKAALLDTNGSYQAAQAAYNTAVNAQVPEDTLKAEADVAQAKANLDLNQSIVNSRKQLLAEGAIPGRDLDTAQAALVQAQAAYDAAEKHLESMRNVTQAAAIESAKGQLASAQGKYKGAEAMVDFSEIRSPIDGVVTDRPLFAGETAGAGAPLITVMETRTLIAKMHIAQQQAQQLKLGGKAEMTVPGVADPVSAKISLISPALDPGSSTVEIWLAVDNKSGALKAGTPVRCSVVGQTVADVLNIPLSAVLTADDGSKSVMVVAADGTAQPKKIMLGINNGQDVQVLSGLSVSDQVITVGSYGLDPGTKVKVVAAESDDDSGKSGGDK